MAGKVTNHQQREGDASMPSIVRRDWDLLVIFVLGLLLAAAVVLVPSSLVRILLGLPFACFSPGYVLLAMIFPARDDLGDTERIALSVGLSAVVLPLIGLILNFTPWGIQLLPILVTDALFIVCCSAVAYYRRASLPPLARFIPNIEFNLPHWQRMGSLDRVLFIALGFTIALALSAFAYAVAAPRIGERYTEFYILGPAGTAEDYPTEVAPGQPVDLIIGVVNHEQGDMQYRIERVDPSAAETVASFPLAKGESWEQPYTFTLSQFGADQKVEFLLYKQDETGPYRSLHLWITASEH